MKATFRTYTSHDYGHIYKGWFKVNHKNLDSLRSWLESGHYVHLVTVDCIKSFQGKSGFWDLKSYITFMGL